MKTAAAVVVAIGVAAVVVVAASSFHEEVELKGTRKKFLTTNLCF